MAVCFVLAMLGALFLGAFSTEVCERAEDPILCEFSDETIANGVLIAVAAVVVGVGGFVAFQIAGFVG